MEQNNSYYWPLDDCKVTQNKQNSPVKHTVQLMLNYFILICMKRKMLLVVNKFLILVTRRMQSNHKNIKKSRIKRVSTICFRSEFFYFCGTL